jgi:hypothetical protein
LNPSPRFGHRPSRSIKMGYASATA